MTRPNAQHADTTEEEDAEEEDDEEDLPWAGAAPPLRKGLAAGSPITLAAIASKPQLNGRNGWSLGIHPTSGRCMVLLEPELEGERPPAPFSVRPECVDGGEAFAPDLSSVSQYISDAQIREALDGATEGVERTVERTKLAVRAAHTVLERFYYGPGGLDGLEYSVAKRINYLLSVFESSAKLEWWVKQVVASGSPDFLCEHTGAEVHFYCLNHRQIAAFVRTGYDPTDGILPQEFHSCLTTYLDDHDFQRAMDDFLQGIN